MTSITFSETFGKEDNLARYSQIYGNVLPKFSVPLVFLQECSGIFVGIVGFSETQQFSDFLDTFLGNFRAKFPHFGVLRIFVEWKAPQYMNKMYQDE